MSINKIYHSELYPSSLRLPVIPGEHGRTPAPIGGALRNQPYRPARGTEAQRGLAVELRSKQLGYPLSDTPAPGVAQLDFRTDPNVQMEG